MMLINIIELITFIALVCYIVFGGADYGAGILELVKEHTLGKKEIQNVVNKAIGPVWEANHIWLILIVVIFFNGFPLLYTTITTYLHIPIVFILTGIVLRGVAFTLRHYDIFEDSPNKMYTTIFSLSSIWTSMWLGITAGAMILGRINLEATSAFDLYVKPWFNFFSFSVGFFMCCVFSYLASSFLITETKDRRIAKHFRRYSQVSNVAVIVSGGFVFLSAYYENLFFIHKFFSNKYSLLMMILATICWLIQVFMRNKFSSILKRPLVIGQVVFILMGFLFVQAPIVIHTTTVDFTMGNSAAPDATLLQLLIALLVGLVLIVPALFYLFWIFKFNTKNVS